MASWQSYFFGDIVDLYQGLAINSKTKYLVSETKTKTPLLRIKDLLENSEEIYIDSKNAPQKSLVNRNDLVFTRTGQVGYVFMGRYGVLHNNCFRIVPRNNDLVLNEFLFYHFKVPGMKEFLTSISAGSVQPDMNHKIFKTLKIQLPPLQEQRAIAEVLSSLDNKIELLQKQNETLEALAQTLFRQWFIEEADDSWEEAELKTLGSIVCGKTPSKKMKEYFGGDIPFVKIPDMHNLTYVLDSSEHLSTQGSDSQINKLIPPDSVLVSCIATVGVVSMNYSPCHTNQQINTIIPKSEVWTIYIYLLMKSLKPVLIQYASGGTATMNLNTGQFSKLQVLSPPKETLIKFNTVSRPLFKKIKQNLLSIRTLTQTRDTLLPKLMSGQVRVKLD
jgi:type I restriction enzyme, S subunit